MRPTESITSDLPPFEFGTPGPSRDRLVAAVLAGRKVATSALLRQYGEEAELLPDAGARRVLVDSANAPVAVVELLDVRVIRLGDADLQLAVDEGEGFETVQEWRDAHESFWNDTVRPTLRDPDRWQIDDDTQIVVERFRAIDQPREATSMTDAPTTLQMPNGSSFTIVEATASSGGERIEFEATLPPNTNGPPPHSHPRQHESWRVIDGELTITVNGREQTLTRGQEQTVPPGTAHTFANRTTTPVRFRDIHTPALDFQQYMETLDRLTQAGELAGGAKVSSLIYGAMVLRRYRSTQVSASLARRAAESVLALLGRALGYKVD